MIDRRNLLGLFAAAPAAAVLGELAPPPVSPALAAAQAGVVIRGSEGAAFLGTPMPAGTSGLAACLPREVFEKAAERIRMGLLTADEVRRHEILTDSEGVRAAERAAADAFFDAQEHRSPPCMTVPKSRAVDAPPPPAVTVQIENCVSARSASVEAITRMMALWPKAPPVALAGKMSVEARESFITLIKERLPLGPPRHVTAGIYQGRPIGCFIGDDPGAPDGDEDGA